MMDYPKEILKELKGLLFQKYKEEIKDVILFGSKLSGKADIDSDYDILILLKRPKNWRLEREISDICYEIDLKYGILTDTHILSEDELEKPRGKQPIFINAISHGFHA